MKMKTRTRHSKIYSDGIEMIDMFMTDFGRFFLMSGLSMLIKLAGVRFTLRRIDNSER